MQQKKKKEINFFDKSVKESEWDWMGNLAYKRILYYFEKFVKPKKNEKLLDMGCGTGDFLFKLKKYNLNLTGMDISKKAIDIAKKKNTEITFLDRDIEKTKFKDKSFDIITLATVLHHFPEPSHLLKEIYRILKPNGRLFAYDPNYRNPVMYLFRAESSPFYSSKNRTENEVLLKKEDIKRIFHNSDFENVDVVAISGITYKLKYFKKLFRFPLYLSVYGYNLFEIFLTIPFLQKKFGSFFIKYSKK